MKLPIPKDDWSDDWKALYNYDLMHLSNRTYEDLLKTSSFKNWSKIGFKLQRKSYKRRLNAVLHEISKIIQPPASILDIGAAEGDFANLKMTPLGMFC